MTTRHFTIYGKVDCFYCKKAKTDLASMGYTFDDYDVLQDPSKYDEMMKLVPGVRTVPQIFENVTYIGGYTELRANLINNQTEDDLWA